MRKLMVLGTLLASLPAGGGGVQAASFDCSRARTADEIAICGNRGINDLDVRMATLFEVATGFLAMGQRGAIQDEQRNG